jgi:hypothetical protein
MFQNVIEFVKKNGKVVITVALAGIGGLTVGYNNGCTVGFSPAESPPAVTAPAAH